MTTPDAPGNLEDAPAFVRTAVPFVVGYLVARLGFSDNDPATALAVSSAAGYGWYVVVHLIEKKVPGFGVLLGIAKRPVYVTPPAIVSDDAGTRVVGDVDI